MNDIAHNDREPDASFHDIGKIVNWDELGLRGTRLDGKPEPDPHEFQQCVDENWNSPQWGVDASALPWQSVLIGYKKCPLRWTSSMHRWHAKVADWLVAGYARGELAAALKNLHSIGPRWGRYSLWRATQSEDRRLNTQDSLRELIELLNRSPEWSDVEQRYRTQLRSRAEEATAGANVTTLLAHCRAVGKLARVLSRAEWKGVDPGAGPTQRAARALQHPPTLIVSHLRLGFQQRPFRARDLGMFAYMEDRLAGIAEDFADNVLSRFGFQCVAVFESADSRTKFVRALEEAGFTLDEQSVQANIGEYLPASDGQGERTIRGLMSVLDGAWKPVYAEEPAQRIDLPICEGCQMARATRHWGLEEENHTEHLCDRCFDIRTNTPAIGLLRDWEGDVLYLRIALDLELLAGHDRRRAGARQDSALERLHKDYLRSLNLQADQSLRDNLYVSFPLVVDFVDDYKALLDAVWDCLVTHWSDRVARLAPELFCLGIESPSESFDVLEAVDERFLELFPKIVELPTEIKNPVGIALSLSKKKHPFFDHWRFLKEPSPDVSVQMVGSGTARFRLSDRERVVNAVRKSSRSQLHRLARAAGISMELGRLVLRERDKQGIVLRELSELLLDRLDFESVRVMANLMEDQRWTRPSL